MKYLLSICLSVCLLACAEKEQTQFSDGPYVLRSDDAWQAFWMCNGQAKRFDFPPPKQHKRIEKCDLSAELYNQVVTRPALAFNNVSKVAAISDIHGQFDLFKHLLTVHKIADAQGNWTFGEGHLVVTGDIFDRGPKVTESLWYLFNLDRQARQKGGFVHFLLGNHEVMVLNNDMRYLHDKYVQTEKVLGQSLSQLFGPESVLGEWLLTRNVLVKIDGMLFVHGGIHPSLATENRSLQDINQTFVDHLIKDENSPREDFSQFLHKTNGQIWYRGYFKTPGASMQEVDALLQHFDVSHLVVGHTTQEHITGFYDGKVIAIDSGIKRGESGEILLVDDGILLRGLMNGTQETLEH